uniref:Uncharacterized protein n=1 Tax=Myotis myotis TaxID=51298 RepID=A0A7J8AM66_MYOMY|nr:hypothetical protein mMyoMyo1_008024 [Myotis myotis]
MGRVPGGGAAKWTAGRARADWRPRGRRGRPVPERSSVRVVGPALPAGPPRLEGGDYDAAGSGHRNPKWVRGGALGGCTRGLAAGFCGGHGPSAEVGRLLAALRRLWRRPDAEGPGPHVTEARRQVGVRVAPALLLRVARSGAPEGPFLYAVTWTRGSIPSFPWRQGQPGSRRPLSPPGSRAGSPGAKAVLRPFVVEASGGRCPWDAHCNSGLQGPRLLPATRTPPQLGKVLGSPPPPCPTSSPGLEGFPHRPRKRSRWEKDLELGALSTLKQQSFPGLCVAGSCFLSNLWPLQI